MSELQPLFTALRAACSMTSWSRGVELSRAGAVDGLSESDDELLLRVVDGQRKRAVQVRLYPDDGEWDCDCGGEADACEHAAAAVIAVRAARKRGEALPTAPRAGGRLGYRLRGDGDGLAIDRVVRVEDGSERPLEGALVDADWHPGARRLVEPSAADLRIDAVLASRRVRSLRADVLASVLVMLSEVDDLRLDGEPIMAGAQPLRPCAVLERSGRGHRLSIEPNPLLLRIVVAGVALCRSGHGPPVLRVLSATARFGARWQGLPCVERFGDDRLAELAGKGVAELGRRFDLEVRCELPRPSGPARPRPAVELSQRGAALSARAAVVYGDPVCARLEGDRLVHLGGAVPKRDRSAEGRVAASLRERFDLLPGKRVDLLGEDALRLVASLRSFDGALFGEVLLDRYPVEPLEPELGDDVAAPTLCFAAPGPDGGMLGVSADAVLEAWQRGQRAVALDGGGWAHIPSGWLDSHAELVSDVLAARASGGERTPLRQLAVARLCDALDQPRPPDLGPLAALLDEGRTTQPVVLPADLTAELRPYQQSGAGWLCLLRDAGLGAVLADDMGLGKTLQALCALRGRALVVCPTSVVHGWLQQAARFRPALSVSVYHGSKRRLDADADVTITSYALLRGDQQALARVVWDCVILDEAQNIKNPDSQVAGAAFSLRARFRVAMSGTPIENRLEELWSQMRFANPGLLGDLATFQARYVEPLSRGDAQAGSRLRGRIRPFLLRRTKDQVGRDLPPRSEAVLYCELDEDEREAYQALGLATRRDAVARLRAGGNVLEALQALLRLRQAACDLALVPGLAAQARVRGGPSSKLRRLLEALEEITVEGHKALVFSQWTSLLDRVEPLLRRRAIDWCRLDGSTRDRAAVVDAFQSAEGPPVMLVSLKAGGTGLDLTAADHVFLLDPWWNPAVEDQAADRAHRIGQERPVFIHHLVSRGTVEERLLALQQRKRALADAIVSDGTGTVGLDRAELLALLEA